MSEIEQINAILSNDVFWTTNQQSMKIAHGISIGVTGTSPALRWRFVGCDRSVTVSISTFITWQDAKLDLKTFLQDRLSTLAYDAGPAKPKLRSSRRRDNRP
jgi:hypothetical protein